jgi:hypothetical protein
MALSHYLFTSNIDFGEEKVFDDILGFNLSRLRIQTLYTWGNFVYRVWKPLMLCVIVRQGEWDKNEKKYLVVKKFLRVPQQV